MDNFIEMLYARFLLSEGVSIDTRTINDGELFFSLSGPNFNGNQYAENALDRGAAYVVIDDPDFMKDDPRYIFCQDALKALQDLAVFHRSKFKRPVIGLTGSNGKTTTKELIAAVLSKKYITSATEGNLNNHIGVPLSIMNIYPQVEIAIIEMGANHVGEIAELSQITAPTHGLITNIGHAHTEFFGGIEGVMRGKSELYDYLKKHKGQVLVNDLDHRLARMSHRFADALHYPDNDVQMIDSEGRLSIRMAGQVIQTKLFGTFNYANVSAAIKVGRYFEVPDELIAEALTSYSPENMRSQIIESQGSTIIMDAYNANPDSMNAALENLASMKTDKKMVVLGDMNELEDSVSAHKEVGEWLSAHPDIEVVLVGPKIKAAKETCPEARWFADVDLAKEYLSGVVKNGVTVLLKASRSIKLEQLKDTFVGETLTES